jgi:hypothetical protein
MGAVRRWYMCPVTYFVMYVSHVNLLKTVLQFAPALQLR